MTDSSPEPEEETPVRPPFYSFVDGVAEVVSREDVASDSVTPRLSLMMRRVNQLMSDDATRRVYRPHGWSHAGFRICIALWVMGPMASHRVTAMTNMGRATVSAALKRISDEGLVIKEPSPDDLRSVHVRLTPLGEEKIRESYAVHLAGEHEWLDAMTLAEKHMLLMLLEKLAANAPRR